MNNIADFEVESRVRAIASKPPTLAALQEAIEIISTVKGFKTEIKLSKSLNVTIWRKSAIYTKYQIDLADEVYEIFYHCGPDADRLTIRDLEKLAWFIVTGYSFQPRHIQAAHERLLLREGKGSDRIPLKYILEEYNRENAAFRGDAETARKS